MSASRTGSASSSGIHWHGMTCPWRQDGVPYISQPPIEPGGHRDYKFPATPAGTRFMHSHFGLQEQDLLAAPLIIREASLAGRDLQEVVVVGSNPIAYSNKINDISSVQLPPGLVG